MEKRKSGGWVGVCEEKKRKENRFLGSIVI
jgi:hypothetical protein